MKTLLAILFFLGVFMGMFFLLSLIGLLWVDSYKTIISDNGWFMAYTLFLGWWIAMIPTIEITNKYKIDF